MSNNRLRGAESKGPRRGSARRPRDARSWAKMSRALLIAALGIVAALLSVALTASTLIRRSNPDLAARMMPIDSVAVSYQAEQRLASGASGTSSQVADLARSALRLQALNPKAFTVLGTVALTQGNENAGRAFVEQAQRQSRRNSSVQFWLIQDAVRRGDVRGALAHYDIVLRTKPNSQDMLFPILLNALKEPTIRAAFGRYYHNDVIWAPQFASYALANSKDLDALTALELESGGLSNRQLAQDLSVGLIGRLALENRFAAARRVYLAMPGVAASKLVDARFDETDLDARYGPIGWRARTQADASATLIEGEGDRPEMLLSANALTIATIATKLLYLKPGRYRVDVALSKVEGGEGAAVSAQVRCPGLTGDTSLWTQRATANAIRGEFVLPAGCDAQYLDIVVRGGSSGNTLDATVHSVAVRPS